MLRPNRSSPRRWWCPIRTRSPLESINVTAERSTKAGLEPSSVKSISSSLLHVDASTSPTTRTTPPS
jgi:hypothetical protein